MNLVETIIKRFNLNVLSIDNVPESFSSQVYKLNLTNGETLYAKIPYNRDKLYREYRMLELLREVLPVPKVLDFWSGDDLISGALLLSEIKGIPCTGAIDDELAFQIGVLHAKLHEVKMPGYGVEGLDGFQFFNQNNWRLYIRNSFEKFIEPCKEVLERGLFEKCINYFKGAFSVLPPPDGPCVVHMDFRQGNILTNNNMVVGIIDFESARGGSSEIDFTKINRYVWEVNPQSRISYKEGYSTIRPLMGLETILPFYDFYDAFGAVVWCKNRGIEKNRAFLKESISVLQKSVGC
ncbi:phosphotransferase [Paenibacillus odorifer]|uniref:phosphotransferase family protein n=1 Tax=Paenibacillus TaxID=44249 RepID=UPI00096FF53D|nr:MULTISPECIES: phosphotransferase [Paenibacillus]MDH6427467.1 Ser/Thr protein kinase RdoA (MazF antagonist) [Paenibacillus sp. PastH-4]MDH6443497.1 Ser/Thr protein kinase RdoA (MazF antagonist) [Paenibacillus sp. PastF-4]MDH6525799.1 Ser/Thr protein kinase RdoA (MazF antagonist) [Paenibacillus sp. PastH-3]OMD66540.1 phosphotransferase [Paenibacillus odorifer]